MQGRGGGRDPFSDFNSPFGGFGGLGGFGPPRSLMSSFFGGKDPFDDPFFTRPFGGMFESSFFGPNGSPFTNMHPPAFFEHSPAFPAHTPEFLEHQPPEPKRSRGPIIEELDSDDEREEAVKGKNENPRKHSRSSNGPLIQDPDDGVEERRSRHLQHRNDYSQYNVAQQPQTHSFTFSSSTVAYGGADGAYYTSSKTRRTGSDGLTFEEDKEADTSTRQATHRVSRGLYNKGHSVARKLNSDGKVDTMQALHNLNEDELSGFEEAWNGNARKHMPGWTGNFIGHNNMGAGMSGQNGQASQGARALPSTEQPQNIGRVQPQNIGRVQPQNIGRVMPERHGSARMQQTGRKKN